LRRRHLDAREAVTVGGDRAQHGAVAGVEGVEEDAVEIIARLFRGDRELRLVDEALEVAGREREAVGQIARGEIREIAFGQGLEHEARAPGADLHLAAVACDLERHLRALGELAHDVVDHMGRHGGGARGRDLGGIVSVTSMSRSVALSCSRRPARAGARWRGSESWSAARRRDAHARATATGPPAQP
jgi:hypothetical protein